jgi:ABC-type glycerol-3-phosphate transport system permease component
VRVIFLAVIILLMLFPLVMMVVGSFVNIRGVMSATLLFTVRHFTLDNYSRVLTGKIFPWAMNTILISGVTICLSLLTIVTSGYGFSRYRGWTWLFWIFLATIMIPRYTLIIPMFVIIRTLGIGGTRMAAILPLVWYPVGIAIYKSYCDTIPRDLMDSARIDGAGEGALLRLVVAPITTPAIAAVSVFKFLEAMTDYLWQMLVLQAPERRTLLVGMVNLIMQKGFGNDMTANVLPIGVQLAVGVILFVPLMAIYVPFRKYFITGISTEGLK